MNSSIDMNLPKLIKDAIYVTNTDIRIRFISKTDGWFRYEKLWDYHQDNKDWKGKLSCERWYKSDRAFIEDAGIWRLDDIW